MRLTKFVLVLTLLCVSFAMKAQIVEGIGIMGGISYGNQKFVTNSPVVIDKKNYQLGFNGSFFVEFFRNEYARWVSELQYNQKGSVDKQPNQDYTNKLQYACWNNYLKLRYEMLTIIPYVLIGPRLEFIVSQSTSSPPVVGNFSAVHVSPAVGAGVEFVSYGNISFITDVIYNPDFILPAYTNNPLDIYNKVFELRVGLKYHFRGRTSCNTPTPGM